MGIDPLLPDEAGEKDLQRLLKENRELRQANAALRVTAESSSRAAISASGGKPGGKDRAGAASGVSSESAGVESVTTAKRLKEEVQRIRQELERAQSESRQARDEYKNLKAAFESFVVQVCEREEAYKLVFARAHEETTEQRRLVESLRGQIQESSQEAKLKEKDDAKLNRDGGDEGRGPAVVVQGVDPASLHDIVGSLHDVLDEFASRVGFSPGATRDHQPRRRLPTTGAIKKSLTQIPQAPPSSSLLLQQQQQQKLPQLIVPARGAGALRAAAPSVASGSTTTERRKRGRPPSAEPKTEQQKQPQQSQQLQQQQKEKRRLTEEAALRTGSAGGHAAALFDGFVSRAERPASRSDVNFGSEPIADYMRLLERTGTDSVDVLRRELIRFCAGDLHVLAAYAVEHFLSKALLAAPMVTLWKHAERTVLISGDVFPAFARAAVRKLVQLLGPESAAALDHRPQLRALSLALRMACAARVREKGSSGNAVQLAFYECTVSAMRTWRVAAESAAAGTTAKPQDVLAPWMTAARHLCGFVEEFHMLMKYYANTERVLDALALPNSLSRYAAQAVMTQCFLAPHAIAIPIGATVTGAIPTGASGANDSDGAAAAAAAAAQCERWAEFCDAMDWSRSILPCDAVGAGAVRILAHAQDPRHRGEALLALRLIVLQRGVGALQGFTEQLRAAGADVDVDTTFAELFSVAVVDLQLSDPRDEQWGRAMAFFKEYLASASIEQAKSAEELLARCTDTHLLVMRAVLQLCCGADTLSDEGASKLGDVLCWAKALRIALERAARDKDSDTTASHPLRRTVLGRELLYLCQQEL